MFISTLTPDILIHYVARSMWTVESAQRIPKTESVSHVFLKSTTDLDLKRSQTRTSTERRNWGARQQQGCKGASTDNDPLPHRAEVVIYI